MTSRSAVPSAAASAASFAVIPAIDIRGGRCVRLLRGDYDRETQYPDDPVAVARRWERMGAPLIHVVDLDGARTGAPENATLIATICQAVNVPVEVSGGMRTLAAIQSALEGGAARVQLGSAAVADPGLVREACAAFPGAIVVAIDAKDGEVMIDGWTRASGVRATDLARRAADLGAPRIMYTDIARDGALEGPNVSALREIVESVPIPVIASGGISTLDQLREVIATGCEGAIIGKALYEGHLDLREALAASVAPRGAGPGPLPC